MKITKRILAALLLLTLTALLLFSCADDTVTYKMDVPAVSVLETCASPLASFSLLSPADEDYITYRMMLNTTTVDSYAVYIQNAGTSIDEIGIFQCASEDTAAVVAMVEDYLTRRNEEWTGQYLVEEYPKLENAEYRVIGRYVVYGILSDEDKETLFTATESFLLEG